jgi:hypothetical protein
MDLVAHAAGLCAGLHETPCSYIVTPLFLCWCRSLVAGVHQLPVCAQAWHISLPGPVVFRGGGRPRRVNQDSSTEASNPCICCCALFVCARDDGWSLGICVKVTCRARMMRYSYPYCMRMYVVPCFVVAQAHIPAGHCGANALTRAHLQELRELRERCGHDIQ